MRRLSYCKAIREALYQEMYLDKNVILFGLGVNDPKAIQGSTDGLHEKLGSSRVFDTPLSEDAMTGIAVGMALAGLRPVHVHIRMDFLMLAMNQLVNVAAKMSYMYGGQFKLPMVVRSMIGKSWGQGGQHSQGLYSFFMHVPGLKVVVPSNAYLAKGCLIKAIRDDNPVMYVEHRLLYPMEDNVPEESYICEEKAIVTREGPDITLVGISHAHTLCMKAAEFLSKYGIQAEVIDPVWLSPLDMDTINISLYKTENLVVVDNGWTTCGAGAEIVAQAVEKFPGINVKRLGFVSSTCPTTPSLEKIFYPGVQNIVDAVYDLLYFDKRKPVVEEELSNFKGPF